MSIGKKSIGVSTGIKGFHVGVNSKKGAYTSAGIPGTGLYGQQFSGGGKDGKQTSAAVDKPPAKNVGKGCCVLIICLFLVLIAINALLS